MKKLSLMFGLFLFGTSLLLAGQTGIVVAQEVITGEADYGTGRGQSFLLPAGEKIAAIQLHIGSVGNHGGSVRVRLWAATGRPGSHFTRDGNEPLAAGTLDRSAVTATPGWFTITLDQSFTNASTEDAYLVFEIELLTSGGDGWNNYSYSDANSYAGGHSVVRSGDEYVIQDGEDLTFRILEDSTTAPVAEFVQSTLLAEEDRQYDLEISISSNLAEPGYLYFEAINAEPGILSAIDLGSEIYVHPDDRSVFDTYLYFNNSKIDGSPVTFQIRMTGEPGTSTEGVEDILEVTIIDDEEEGAVFWAQSAYTLREEVGTVNLRIERFPGDSTRSTVHLRTIDGSAVEGQDYSGLDQEYTFAENQRVIDVPIATIGNESSANPLKDFTVELSSAASGTFIEGSAVTSVIVNDKDDPGSLIQNYDFPASERMERISDAELFADGSMLVLVGYRREIGPGREWKLIQFDQHGNGSIFAALVSESVYDTFYDIEFDYQGRVYVGGPMIQRFTSDGAPDPNFKNNLGPGNRLQKLLVLPSGKILGVGSLKNPIGDTGITRLQIARFHSDGSLDTGFDAGAFVYTASQSSWVRDLQLDPKSDKIYIAGQFDSIQGHARKGIARLHTNGELDLSFDASAALSGQGMSTASTLDLTPEGTIYTSGFSSFRKYKALRLLADGTLDNNFEPIIADRAISFIQPDGKLHMGGPVRYLQSGAIDAGYSVQSLERFTSLTPLQTSNAEGELFYFGEFYEIDGVPSFGIAKVKGDAGAALPTITWDAASYAFGEGIGVAAVPISRSHTTQDSAAVHVDAVSSVPGNDTDIVQLNPIAAFSGNELGAVFSFQVSDDDEVGTGQKDYTLVAHHPINARIDHTASAAGLRILDDDGGTINRWLARTFPESPQDETKYLADDDADGIVGLVEYMNGTNPLDASSRTLPKGAGIIEAGATPKRYATIQLIVDPNIEDYFPAVERSDSLKANSWETIWSFRDDPDLDSTLILSSPPTNESGWLRVRDRDAMNKASFLRVRYIPIN